MDLRARREGDTRRMGFPFPPSPNAGSLGLSPCDLGKVRNCSESQLLSTADLESGCRLFWVVCEETQVRRSSQDWQLWLFSRDGTSLL